MTDKNVRISFDKEEVEFQYNDQTIVVESWISFENKKFLVKRYLEELFGTDDKVDAYYNAELSLVGGIVDLCTNLTVPNEHIGIFADGELWKNIRERIKNYYDLFNDIETVSANIYRDKSVDKSLSKLSDKIVEFLDQIAKMDLSENGDLSKLLKELPKTLEEAKEIGVLNK